jgi:aminobenzoyl-glutamate transport protein
MSANFFVGNLDVLISGITQSVTTQLGYSEPVHVLMHWYFLATTAVVLTIGFTIVTEKFMRKYVGESSGIPVDMNVADQKSARLMPEENKALRKTAVAAIIFFVVLAIIVLPKGSFFREKNGSLIPSSPFMRSILALLFLFFMTTGIVYGRAIGKIEKWTQLPKILAKSLDSVLGFIVIALPASVFIHLFNTSNMPIVLGVKGANFIKSFNIHGLAILITIAIVTTFMNLFMTSGSAKWMIFAPILIPMFYAVGFSPALTALAYRIGDSATNAVAPISTDIALIIGLLEKYKSNQNTKVGMGTVISLCLPYAIVAFLLMLIQLGVWYTFKLPLGPGVTMFLPGYNM